MMNGEDINQAITRANEGTVANTMKKVGGNITNIRQYNQVINDLYRAALNRPASDQERRLLLARFPLRRQFQGSDSWRKRADDLFWALLNSNEFLLNH
jgi:hypothetical protein